MPEHSTETASPTCPKCGGKMWTRQGSRGPFLGCQDYPACRGTRPVNEASDATPAATRPDERRVEAPGPTGALLTDLRSASGHIGRAIDILRRRQAEIDRLVDAHDGVTF